MTDAERTMLAGRLAGLDRPVRLALYTRPDGCETCAETRAIVDAVAALSPLVSVESHDIDADGAARGVSEAPAIVVLAQEGDTVVDHGVRLVGAPVDHELTSLADAIVTVSTGASALSVDGARRLAALDRPVHVRVFSTPTCVYCPRAVALAHRIAVASPLVSATAYSVVEFPDLIRRYRVTGVPKIVFDTGVELLGVQPEAAFVDAIVGGASA